MLYTNYQGENIYSDDEERNVATHMLVKELDCEGKGTIGEFGIFPIKEEYFDIEVRQTMIEDATYQHYELNERGWEYLESQIDHPGRGWVSFRLVDKKFIDNRLKGKIEQMNKLQTEIENLKQNL